MQEVENKTENLESSSQSSKTPMVEQQKETAKAVKKTVKAKTTKRKAVARQTVPAEKVIKAASNPPRPDRRVIEKGDLLIPVEDK